MATVLREGGHQDPPSCPTCEAAMVIRPTAQFHYAAGFDEIIYACEKCQTVSTVIIAWGQPTWSNPSPTS